jgi:hypothetical protein
LESFADPFIIGGIGGWVFPVSFAADLDEDAEWVVLR